MIPPSIPADTKSPGEVEVFVGLRDDPLTENWTVLHSLDLSDHVRQVRGEADFVVVIPDRGIVVVEVKGVRSLDYRDGVWFYGRHGKGETRGPFKQAREAMYSLREDLERRVPASRSVLTATAVVLPFVTFDKASPEWSAHEVIDERKLSGRSIGACILGALEGERQKMASVPQGRWAEKASLEEQLAAVLIDAMRPSFEVIETPRARLRRVEKELLELTEEQFAALDGMEANQRVVFDGPAGTGKTVLAVEAARRAAQRGERVLLCCFNRALGVKLKREFEENELVDAGTLSAHMLQTSGLTVREDASFWAKDLPNAALEAVLESGSHYDIVVVDEAQDLLEDQALDYLDAIVAGGLRSGRWFWFGDLTNQRLYTDLDPDAVMAGRALDAARYALTTNCRNTPRIAAYADLLGRLDRKYVRVRRADDGVEPSTHFFGASEDQATLLTDRLDALLAEGYEGRDIAVLSPRRDGVASSVPSKWRARFRSPTDDRGGITVATVWEFKGLESPVVVLTDVERYESPLDRALVYVAATRAIDRLEVLAHQGARDALAEAVLQGGVT